MKIVSNVFDVLEKALKGICVFLTLDFTLITCASIIARYVFKAPFSWSEQTCRYLFIWSVMLYMPVIMRAKGNLGFDLLVNRLPRKAQDFISLFCMVLIDIFAVLYCKFSVQFVLKTMGKKLSGINAPYWSVYSAQIIGAGILALFTTELIIKDIIRLKNKSAATEEVDDK